MATSTENSFSHIPSAGAHLCHRVKWIRPECLLLWCAFCQWEGQCTSPIPAAPGSWLLTVALCQPLMKTLHELWCSACSHKGCVVKAVPAHQCSAESRRLHSTYATSTGMNHLMISGCHRTGDGPGTALPFSASPRIIHWKDHSGFPLPSMRTQPCSPCQCVPV